MSQSTLVELKSEIDTLQAKAVGAEQAALRIARQLGRQFVEHRTNMSDAEWEQTGKREIAKDFSPEFLGMCVAISTHWPEVQNCGSIREAFTRVAARANLRAFR